MKYGAIDLLLLVLILFCIAAVAFWLYTVYERKRAEGSPIIEAGWHPEPPIIHHYEYGAVQPVKCDLESETSGLCYGIDRRGRGVSWPGHEEEFHIRNRLMAGFCGLEGNINITCAKFQQWLGGNIGAVPWFVWVLLVLGIVAFIVRIAARQFAQENSLPTSHCHEENK